LNDHAEPEKHKMSLPKIKGLRTADPRETALMQEYERAMAEAIPRMIWDVERRAVLAAKARQRIMRVLQDAAKTVAPLVASEREGERVSQGLMEFVLR
jgi:hypothetical protein